MYGLKHASRKWFLKFISTLLIRGFCKSHNDHTVFIKNTRGKYVAVLVYVDEIIIARNDDEVVDQLKFDLQKVFKLGDLGPFKYFLGLEIVRPIKGISLCQRKYVLGLLEETRKMAFKPSSIPMDPAVKLFYDPKLPLIDDPSVYKRLVGRLHVQTLLTVSIKFVSLQLIHKVLILRLHTRYYIT